MNSVPSTEQKNISGLSRYLSPVEAWSLAFGCAVGWGAFVMPGTLFIPAGGPLGAVLGLLVGTVVMLIIGKNYQYMINQYPNAGGSFSYTKKIFGHDHGFFNAWFLGLAYIAIIWANDTALSLIARGFLPGVLQVGPHYQVLGYDVYWGEALFSVAALLLVGFICIRGKRLAVRLQVLFATLLLLGIMTCFSAVGGIHEGGVESFEPFFATDRIPISQIFLVMSFAPWAFIGFESISHSAEEFSFSTKKIYAVMATALIAGFLAYALLAVTAVTVMPAEYDKWPSYLADLKNLEGMEALPTLFATNKALGDTGILLFAVAALAGIVTGMIGNFIGASRLLYSLGKNNILPSWFCELGKDNTPRNAILFITMISVLIPFVGRTVIGWTVDVLTIAAAIAYGYTSAAAYVTAKRNGDRFIEATGIIGIIMSIVFSIYLLVPNIWDASTMARESYLILAVWSVLGFVFFRYIFKQDTERNFGQSTVAWIAMLFLIFFSSLMWMRQSAHLAMESVIKDTKIFYTFEMDTMGIQRNRYREEAEEAFLEKQATNIRETLMWSSTVQMLLIVLSLGIMFNIYSALRSRERDMEVNKIKAEEQSMAKTVFLSNMSHDIRTPMNAIIGYIELSKGLQEECDACHDCQSKKCVKDIPKKRLDFMNKIESASQHLLELINDILEMSRIESGKMELNEAPADLCRIVRDAEDLFATQMKTKGVTFKVDVSHIIDRNVLCDASRLNRVLLNLISNAYKFTPEGGTVAVTLSQQETCSIASGEDGEEEWFLNYELRVKDSGIGMSKEFAQKVFSAFERERTSTVSGIQGTGLGMAITKNIIDLMHGSIRVVTSPGNGTEFIVSMKFKPAPKIEEEPEEAQETVVEAIDFTKKHLLLVDDIDVNREIAIMLLTTEGFTVDSAADGKEALDKVAASKPGDYDLILMDIQMPVMNGYEATKAIRALPDPALANIPIIAMTANAFSEDVQNAKDAGMNGHIAKPLDIPKMMETLQEVLGEK